MKFLVLWSDVLIFMLCASLTLFFWNMRHSPITRERWRQVFGNRLGMVTFVVLASYILVALADSIHFQRALSPDPGQVSEQVYYDNQVTSALDVLLGDMSTVHERTYSSPFAPKSFEKINFKNANGESYRDFPLLEYAGAHLEEGEGLAGDIVWQSILGLLKGVVLASILIASQWFFLRQSDLPWRAA